MTNINNTSYSANSIKVLDDIMMTDKFECICGKTFSTKKQLSAHCGRCNTHRKYIHEVITKVCPICGKEFTEERVKNNQTCSKSCGSKLNALHRGQNVRTITKCKCVVCGKEFETDKPERAKICSFDCYSEYAKLRGFIRRNNLPDDTTYNEYLHLSEQVKKQCAQCGKEFFVMRIDFNKKNVCSWSCHCAQVKENSLVEKTCPFCNETYKVSPKSTQKTCGKKKCADLQMQVTRKERGYVNGFANPDIQQKIIATNIEHYGVPYYCMTDACKQANQKVVSKPNITLHKKLLQLNIENELEYVLGKFSFDIRAGKYLIEVDPAYTHSCTTASVFDKPKPKTYHQTKTIIANSNNFECIHMFEWDDEDKIIDIINPNKTRVYARNCAIKELTKEEANSFLTTHHLQGTLRMQPIRYGLFYNSELVQVMTFGKPRYNKNYEYELLRLCSKQGVYVVGGAEKLFTHFIRTHNPTSIISYCDNSKFNGDVYLRLGFRFSHLTQPSVHWYNRRTKQHITDQLLRQHGADRLIGTNFGKGTNNQQILLDNGFVGIADCGQKVYEWKQSS